MTVNDMAIELLADSEHALAEDAIRWRTLALAAMAQNSEQQATVCTTGPAQSGQCAGSGAS